MIYSDAENEKWWNGKSLLEKEELFDDIIDGASDSTVAFIESLSGQYSATKQLSSKQINALRKFADNLSGRR